MVEKTSFALSSTYKLDSGPSIPRGLDELSIHHKHLVEHLGRRGIRHIATLLVNKILDRLSCPEVEYDAITKFQYWDDVYSGMLRQLPNITPSTPWSPLIPLLQLTSLFHPPLAALITAWPADPSVLTIAATLSTSSPSHSSALEIAESWGKSTDKAVVERFRAWLEENNTVYGRVRDGSKWVVYDYNIYRIGERRLEGWVGESK
ncbi:hypothetical protein TWF102_006687 [Orbilia oligospora]|uniref:Uncharacterized protein n=1 Tax=Orbilia oligospora TaxID=2813651 RepID=A0A7C8N401_ORBOL|nr:hypothetical protein TWF102_006687 [Orbilia oligospora]KAF3118304.1 hypothetical protein TWF103_000319 [Orbilia oligospora]